ncbi:lysophospholipid acyltransferase family protein [Streptomyces sp. NPDC058572]|uniref:lysophospholipid acyltransferase family protein n=1 Tax=Streptomyces sp. NPDC058572 TaxID=3346546 RepID=UPI00364FD78E
MSVWLPSAPCTPQGCATRSGAPAGRIAATARLLAGTSVVVAGVLLAPVVALSAVLLGPGIRDRLTRRWARAVLRSFGVRVRIVGSPQHRRASLVVANHISWLDIPLVAAVLPGRMVAKSEVRRWPVLGPLAARGGTVFLERDRLRALPATVASMAAAMRAGSRLIVFPEGSTWCGRDQGRFRPAAFQAALDAGVAVQPVRIGYTPTGPAAFVGDDPLGASLWRVVAAGGLTAEIRLLEPILPGACADRRSLARAAQSRVARSRTDQRGPARLSANLPSSSVHQRVSSMSASASSLRTPS